MPTRLPLALAILLLGCQRAPPLVVPPGCQPLQLGFDCMLPYPSDFFRVVDPRQPSGFRIELTGAAQLLTVKGQPADVGAALPIDGFSRVPTVVAAFPVELGSKGFVRLEDPPELSVDLASNTLVLDAETGERVPHFVDLDARAKELTRQAIVLHPLIALKARRRYVVALHGLQQQDGAPVAALEGFRRLRDRKVDGDPALEPMRDHFEEKIFPLLATAGLDRATLQLAWDFTTGSDEQVTADLLQVRELTLAWLQTNTPEITVTSVEENLLPSVWRTVKGTVSMPLFVDSVQAGAKLVRDAAGHVRQNGTATFPFIVQVPASVRDQFGPALPLGFGHGFFGSTAEVENEKTVAIADRLRVVLFATDWWGMHLSDVGKVVDGLLSRPSHAMGFTERVHQAMANWIVLTAAIKGPMGAQPAFLRPSAVGVPGVGVDGSGQSNAGRLTFVPDGSRFLGISQGHILGGVMASVNPDVSRAIFNVGGAGLSTMMMRTHAFEGYLFFLEESLPDPLDQQKYIATMQRPFDRVDPATWAPRMLIEKLPGSPPDRRVLMQIGLGDSEVPNVGAWLHARLLGIPVLTPSPYQSWGLEGAAGPVSGSALAVYDFGLDAPALYRSASAQPQSNLVHEGLRATEAARAQMDRFLQAGEIINPCSGLCDPQ